MSPSQENHTGLPSTIVVHGDKHDNLICMCDMFLVPWLLVIVAATAKSKREVDQIPLVIKGHGIMDLHKGDTALVLYVTVANLGHDPLSLSLVSRSCCQEVSPGDIDCDSMLLIGGDMGDIYPGDKQNLTAFFPNLYLIDRVGYCELEIAVPDGEKILHTVHFNTTVPRQGAPIPAFLSDTFAPGELGACKSPDLDPARGCQPVLCDIKYNGVRNFFNQTNFRCQPTPNCWDTSDDDMVYLSGSNTCRRIGEALTEEDLDFFESFRERKEPLKAVHGYPIKVNCHNGRPDPAEGWCVCNPGWESESLDHDGFNPDFMVYHMCTVFSGTTANSSPSHSPRGKHTKKHYLANVPKKRRRGEEEPFRLNPSRYTKDSARGKVASGHVVRSAHMAAPTDAGSEAPEMGSSFHQFLSEANMVAVILPTLIAAATILSCMVVAVGIFIVFECRKLKTIPALPH